MGNGAGELAISVPGWMAGVIVPLAPSPCSLGPTLLAGSILACSLERVVSLVTSPSKPCAPAPRLFVFQRGTSHVLPVNEVNCRPLFCHLRVGVPVRSRARRFALIAPVLALGLVLCDVGAAPVSPSLWLMSASGGTSEGRGSMARFAQVVDKDSVLTLLSVSLVPACLELYRPALLFLRLPRHQQDLDLFV